MNLIKFLTAPIRRVINSPLFQIPVALLVVLFLQAADSKSIFGDMFGALDWLVDGTVTLCGRIFELRSFTKSSLTIAFMIAYVYIAIFLIVLLAKALVGAAIELAARVNAFGLKQAIARERGIAAYAAWLPLERIRPPGIPQAEWEEKYAWPADGRAPYPSLLYRLLRAAGAYVAAVLIIAALLQVLTPFPALTWLANAVGI